MDTGYTVLGDGRVQCDECRRWDRQCASRIKHSSLCDTPKAAPDTFVSPEWGAKIEAGRAATAARLERMGAPQIKAAAAAGEIAHVTDDEDEIVGLARVGIISRSDAMNRDF